MTDKKRIFLSGPIMPDASARLHATYDAVVHDRSTPLSADDLIGALGGVDGLLTYPNAPLNADVIARLPDSVAVIACHAVGYDNVDLDAARARGIVVTNTPEVLCAATAEVAILLMLGAARRASEGDRLIRAGEWKRWSVDFMVGTEITGQRLGIIGMGDIGKLVARRARGFDMDIHYHNRKPLPADKAEGATYHDSIESLLGVSDVLSINCPLTPATHHLLNEERIALLPRGAIVVNTARGSIIDDAALIDALRSGQVAAAGLDVFEGEPTVNPDYLALPNTFLLPHIGSATVTTRTAMGLRAIDNLDAFFRGDPPPDRIA
ncbi:MAG: D-glycerate dehydrogenase [Sphingomonadales bacterium]